MSIFQKKEHRSRKAQTAIELAVFGSVVIFLIGLIVRSVMTSSYQQNHRYKAFRLAMLMSFTFTEGIKDVPGNWGDGTASRNGASVLIIEDRLSAHSAKYGPTDRVPQLSFASATHSRNLFMPIDPGEYANLPSTDYFINGVHFVFTTANVATKYFNAAPNPADPHNPGNPNGHIFRIENNHPDVEFCLCGGADPDTVCVDTVGTQTYPRFDLDRSGTTTDDNQPGGPSMAQLCDEFWWQWIAGTPDEISLEAFSYADVDGDLEPEQIVGINGKPLDADNFGTRISANVVDFQEGDMDLSIREPNPLDPTAYSRPEAGITPQDLVMYTFTKDFDSSDGDGTYLQIDQGQLISPLTGRFIRSVQRKDSLDLIQRTIQLSNQTQRFCTNALTVVTIGSPEGNRAGWTADIPNPVEACCDTNECCHTPGNADRICMVVPPADPLGFVNPYIFVRSRITDDHGRKWITPTDGDPIVEYLSP